MLRAPGCQGVEVSHGRCSAGRFGADSCTKRRWKCIEIGFAVLCWELLGSFPIAAAFKAAGF